MTGHRDLRINDRLAVFTAELSAISLGMQWKGEVRHERAVMCSDST